MSQKPAISSLVSENGPSITVRLLPENLTRAPFELGWRPSPASITPAFASSSLYLPMSARIFRSGRTPASESLSAFTITMNRIVVFLNRYGFKPLQLLLLRLYLHVERDLPESTRRIDPTPGWD